MRRLLTALVATSLGLAACASDAPSEPADGSGTIDEFDDKADRGSGGAKYVFTEVDEEHSSVSFRRYIRRALKILAEDETELGRLTYRSIADGHVRIDELADLTCADYQRVMRDFKGTETELAPEDFEHLHDEDSEALARLTDALAGYQWSDRIYVARGMGALELASTLVHEVNHVLNRSEVGYYDDLPTSAFRHEYRAFYLETVFRSDRFGDTPILDYVLEIQGWKVEDFAPEVLADPLLPELMPTKAAWDRRGANDPETETCE